jgi:hypothetical protein
MSFNAILILILANGKTYAGCDLILWAGKY